MIVNDAHPSRNAASVQAECTLIQSPPLQLVCMCSRARSCMCVPSSSCPCPRNTGGSLDLKSLCVLPGMTCWVVYVDALLLNDGGNVLDALSIAARAALALTRIPKVGEGVAGAVVNWRGGVRGCCTMQLVVGRSRSHVIIVLSSCTMWLLLQAQCFERGCHPTLHRHHTRSTPVPPYTQHRLR